ncbi:MAG: hypothetical protein WCQ41_07020 [Bacillota bacterium]
MKIKTLVKKEFFEIFRTSKIFVLPLIYIFIAITSPLMAKYTPDLLNTIMQYTGQKINISLPAPTYVDSFIQLFKNIGEMGLFVLIFIYSGTMVEEKTKGTATLILTKGVSRQTFVASKFIASTCFMTIVYILMTMFFAIYSVFLFPDTPWLQGAVSLLMVWVYSELILVIVVLGSIIKKTYASSTVFSFLNFIGISLLGMIPVIDKYTPGYVISLALKHVMPAESFERPLVFADYFWPLGISVVLIALAIFFALHSFRRQEL